MKPTKVLKKEKKQDKKLATDKHTTKGYYCWCNPKIEKYEGGDIIIHNRIN